MSRHSQLSGKVAETEQGQETNKLAMLQIAASEKEKVNNRKARRKIAITSQRANRTKGSLSARKKKK